LSLNLNKRVGTFRPDNGRDSNDIDGGETRDRDFSRFYPETSRSRLVKIMGTWASTTLSQLITQIPFEHNASSHIKFSKGPPKGKL